MQVMGLLSLLVVLRAKTIVTPGRDLPTTVPASSQLPIVNEVLALENSVSRAAEAVLDLQSAVDSTTVRTPVPGQRRLTHYFTR